MKKNLSLEKKLREYAQSLLLSKEKIKLPIVPITEIDQNVPLLYKLLNSGFESKLLDNKLVLPDFNNCESVAVFTDYGGEAKNSKYYTYTVTLVDYNFLGIFDEEMKRIRKEFGLNNPLKEISFKDLRYGPIKRSLDKYLLTINNFVNGLVFTLVIDKNVISLAEQNVKQSKELIAKSLMDSGFGLYKIDVAEKIYRIINLITYLIRLLVPNNKKIFWMSDHDSIIATNEMHKNIGKLFGQAIYSFENVKYNTVGYSKPFPKSEENLFLDLLSISDLVAGAIEHYLTRQKILDFEEFTISDGSNKILMWLANNGLAFKKLTYSIRYDDERGAYQGGFMDFKLKDTTDNINYIDISL
ncbi:hypothetical protein [uncultured Exiguobacterium sp.]|uniref:hypothetical protein n=1 Tax=uncultured Exiguobacterium sp. TaxID=202669 RepID=UPI003749A6AD